MTNLFGVQVGYNGGGYIANTNRIVGGMLVSVVMVWETMLLDPAVVSVKLPDRTTMCKELP